MFYFFLAIFFRVLWATNAEEFYILPMGQGNSQLVIYERPEGKVGILYDLGSKSLQIHPKFASRGMWQQPFLMPRLPEPAKTGKRRTIIPSSPEHIRLENSIQTPTTTDAKRVAKKNDSLKNDLKELIYEQLQSLEHLFIFLSHCDEDHINFLNHENIPGHVPITVILAGDWFGDIGAEEGKTNFTKPAKEVLIFLSQRIANGTSTQFYFPYYSPELNSQVLEILHPQVFLEAIGDKKLTEALSAIESISQPIIPQCLKINPAAPTPPFLHGQFLEVFRDRLAIDSKFHDILRNVYIWSLNQPADNTNNHSMVVSCTLPNLNMSVILTGDAENSVFHRIVTENDNHNFRELLNSKLGFSNPLHNVLLMLPHHGALANRSGSMLRFFMPNVFGIAAGDGRQHGHPSAELIAMIRSIYENEPFSSLLSQFYEQYKYERKFHFISLNREREHTVDKAEGRKLSFLCPNIYGCIKWNHEGIHTNFNNLIKLDDGEKYSVLYAAHVLESDANHLEVGKTNIIPVCLPGTINRTGELILIEKPENFPYEYLAADPNGELFVGVGIVDAEEKRTTSPNTIYFYQLLAAE